MICGGSLYVAFGLRTTRLRLDWVDLLIFLCHLMAGFLINSRRREREKMVELLEDVKEMMVLVL